MISGSPVGHDMTWDGVAILTLGSGGERVEQSLLITPSVVAIEGRRWSSVDTARTSGEAVVRPSCPSPVW